MEVGEAEGGTREEEPAEGEEAADEVGKGGGGGEGSSLARLVCVEYPGVVASPAAALATLGGLDTVAQVGYWGTGIPPPEHHLTPRQVVEEPNRRLELRFRPDDVFCKPACGDRHPGSSLLLRSRAGCSRTCSSRSSSRGRNRGSCTNCSRSSSRGSSSSSSSSRV